MSKETEELIVIAVVGFLFLRLMSGSTAASNTALAQSKIDSATNLGYAADATTLIGDYAGMW